MNIQETIADTAVEVMDKESFDDKNFTTHKIKRKVFLLSAVELGVKFGVDYTMAKEGKALKYFKNKEYIVKKAYKADGTTWPYWTRTPWVSWTTCMVTVIGASKLDAVTADRFLGVRPAFAWKRILSYRKTIILLQEKVYIQSSKIKGSHNTLLSEC